MKFAGASQVLLIMFVDAVEPKSRRVALAFEVVAYHWLSLQLFDAVYGHARTRPRVSRSPRAASFTLQLHRNPFKAVPALLWQIHVDPAAQDAADFQIISHALQ